MRETVVYSFLIVACCVLLFLTGKIWLRIRRISKSGGNQSEDGKTTVNLFGSLCDIHLVVDGKGFISYVNPAFKSAFPDFKIQAQNTRFADLVGYWESITVEKVPEDAYLVLKLHSKPIRGVEIAMVKGNASFQYLLSRDIITENGKQAGFIVTLTDVGSYRKKALEVVGEKSSNASLSGDAGFDIKNAFLTNILSHEIRTPMNTVIGMAEVAKTAENPKTVSESLDKISASAKHLLKIINNALDMSSLESDQYTLYEESFAFSDMIRNITDITTELAKEKKQNFKIAISPNIPNVLIFDELRLAQVINNLLSNAVKFTPLGGNIELAVKLLSRKNQSALLQFSVTDDGIGISEAMQANLFNAFKQSASGYSRQFGGTAMGLAISQRIVGLMGGTIRAVSISGKGSKFTFEINVRIANDQPVHDIASVGLNAASDKDPYDFSGYTVLLVEDVEINREIIRALLKDTGAKIDCAENGQVAVNMCAAKRPGKYSMIYMDIQMPVLDGYSATQRIRKLDADIPIVAMTADASAEDIQKCKKTGMDDHIAKPIDVNELLKKTDKYIRRK